MPAALVGTALPAVAALPPLAAAPAAGLTLLYPFLDVDPALTPVMVLEELEAAVEAMPPAGEVVAGGGCEAPPAPVGVVTSEATECPETTRFMGFGLIRAAMGLSLNVLTSRRKY